MSEPVLDLIPRGRGKALFVVTISFPGSTIYAAQFPFLSSTAMFSNRVISWGTLDYTPSDRSGSLSSVETSVEFDDSDRRIARIYSGVNADSVRGSAATIQIASPDVAPANWRTVFSGHVVSVSFPRPFVASVKLRVNDDRLQRKFPLGAGVIGKTNFPHAHESAIGKTAQIIVGTHDVSNYRTGPGAIPAYLIDTLQHKYMAGAGEVGFEDGDLLRVYKNDVALDVADWNRTVSAVAGKTFTFIEVPGAVDGDTITFDSKGVGGSGWSDNIVNPAEALWFLIHNFGTYETDWATWSTTGADLVDDTSFDAMYAYLDKGSVRASVAITDPVTGLDAISSFCKSFGARAFWTTYGQIGIGRELVDVAPYDFEANETSNIRWNRDEHGSLSLEEDDFKITTRITVSQSRIASDGNYAATFEVTDPTSDDDLNETLELEWSEVQ